MSRKIPPKEGRLPSISTLYYHKKSRRFRLCLINSPNVGGIDLAGVKIETPATHRERDRNCALSAPTRGAWRSLAVSPPDPSRLDRRGQTKSSRRTRREKRHVLPMQAGSRFGAWKRVFPRNKAYLNDEQAQMLRCVDPPVCMPGFFLQTGARYRTRIYFSHEGSPSYGSYQHY